LELDVGKLSQKKTELRDRFAAIKLQLDVLDRSQDENADLTSKVFELSQTLRQRWLTADYAEKRKILDIVWLNCRLDDAKLCPQIRKPPPFSETSLSAIASKGG
jgi:site-specific DNA recombinase